MEKTVAGKNNKSQTADPNTTKKQECLCISWEVCNKDRRYWLTGSIRRPMHDYIYIYIYIPTTPHKQDATQCQFLRVVWQVEI